MMIFVHFRVFVPRSDYSDVFVPHADAIMPHYDDTVSMLMLVCPICRCWSREQKNPSQTPMYTHLNTHSKCGHLRGRSQAAVSAGKVEIVRMSSLMVRDRCW